MVFARKLCFGLLGLICSVSLSIANTPALEKLSVYDKPITYKKWSDRLIMEIMFPAMTFTPEKAIREARKIKNIGFTLRLGSLTGKDDTNIRPKTYEKLIEWAHANGQEISGYNFFKLFTKIKN